MASYTHELAVAVNAAREAAAAIMAVFETANVRIKADGSPVTEADEAADRIIRERIGEIFPDDAMLTEEGADDPRRLEASRVWIVDPIDGTASFVAGGSDFDVYIALAVDGYPVVAVSLQPTTGLLLTAVAGAGAWIERDEEPRLPLQFGAVIGGIRIGTRPWLGAPANLDTLERAARRIGGGAKVVTPKDGLGARSFLSAGRAVDVMTGVPAGGELLDAWEWDVAAVDLIVREAGGAASDPRGDRLRFNRRNPRIEGLVISADPVTHERFLACLPNVPRSCSV